MHVLTDQGLKVVHGRMQRSKICLTVTYRPSESDADKHNFESHPTHIYTHTYTHVQTHTTPPAGDSPWGLCVPPPSDGSGARPPGSAGCNDCMQTPRGGRMLVWAVLQSRAKAKGYGEGRWGEKVYNSVLKGLFCCQASHSAFIGLGWPTSKQHLQ